VPSDVDKVTVAGAELVWHAIDTKNYNLNLFHFATALKKKTSDAALRSSIAISWYVVMA